MLDNRISPDMEKVFPRSSPNGELCANFHLPTAATWSDINWQSLVLFSMGFLLNTYGFPELEAESAQSLPLTTTVQELLRTTWDGLLFTCI